MKEFIVRIPEDSEEIITAVIEKFGAVIEPVGNSILKNKNKKKIKNKKGKKTSATYLFGTWNDVDIDPDKFRDQIWERDLKL
jgi:hypothetical protein